MKRDERLHPESYERLKDPDPISLGFMIFAAVSSGASLIISMSSHERQRRRDIEEWARSEAREREERERSEDRIRRRIRRYSGAADRALDQIDGAYRSLVSIFDEQEILEAPFSLGEIHIYADDELVRELRRLRDTCAHAGQDLEEALDELSELVADELQDIAREYADHLDKQFNEARRSETMLQFMLELGHMLEDQSRFIVSVGERYDFSTIPASTRLLSLEQITADLQRRMEE